MPTQRRILQDNGAYLDSLAWVYYRKGDQPDFVCLGETDKDKTDCVVSELEPLVDHFFAVTAFDTGELESRLSDELKFRVEPWSPGEEDGCFIVTIRN